MTRKVLIVCTGTNDPYSVDPRTQTKSDGPVLSFMNYLREIPDYKNLRPDRIYLLATVAKPGAITPTQMGGEQTRDILLQRGWKEVYLRLLPLSDPTSYKELIPVLREAVEGIVAENKDTECQYFINVSPATGQMEATWLALVNSGFVKAHLLQVKAPWVEPDPLKRVIRIEEAPLFENNRIEVASSLFSRYEFQGAKDVLIDLALRTASPLRADAADLFSDVAEAYFHYDNCAFDKACERLFRALQNNLFKDSKFVALRELVSLQKENLDKLMNNALFESVADIYHRARRYLQTEKYTLCLLSCWQAYEKLVIDAAKNAIRTACKLPEDYYIPYHLGKFVNSSKADPQVTKIAERFPISSWQIFDTSYAAQILQRTKSSVRNVLDTEKDNLEWLEERRHTIVHEPFLSQSKKQDCETALGLISRLIRAFFDKEKVLFDYPFSTQCFEKVSRWISELI